MFDLDYTLLYSVRIVEQRPTQTKDPLVHAILIVANKIHGLML